MGVNGCILSECLSENPLKLREIGQVKSAPPIDTNMCFTIPADTTVDTIPPNGLSLSTH